MKTQGGWLTARGFVLFGAMLILGAAVLFGLYVAKERGEAARRDSAIAVAEAALEEESNREVAITEEAASTTIPGTSAEALPETGPEAAQAALTAAGLGLVTYSTVSYLSSRRTLRAYVPARLLS